MQDTVRGFGYQVVNKTDKVSVLVDSSTAQNSYLASMCISYHDYNSYKLYRGKRTNLDYV